MAMALLAVLAFVLIFGVVAATIVVRKPVAAGVEARPVRHAMFGRPGRRPDRPAPGPVPERVSIDLSLYEPHAGRPRGSAMPKLREPDPIEASRKVAAWSSVHQPLASRFKLPPSVSERVADPDDTVALVAAVLQAAGLEPERRDRTLVLPDGVIVVLDALVGEPVEPEALTAAYMRFKASGAPRGIVVTPGLLDVAEVRRREALDPRLLHAGLDGLQRMADAVAAGENPLAAAPLPAS